MRASSKAARELAEQARAFSHPMLPKKGKQVIEVSAVFLADLVERVERLEAGQCREQKTTESQ